MTVQSMNLSNLGLGYEKKAGTEGPRYSYSITAEQSDTSDQANTSSVEIESALPGIVD